MTMIQNISKFLGGNRPKAFLVDDEAGRCCQEDLEIVKSLNVDVERFPNINSLLYSLRANKGHKYKVGMIHQNGTKYPSQMLSNFIKIIDPSIQLIIYKDGSQLKEETQTMLLT